MNVSFYKDRFNSAHHCLSSYLPQDKLVMIGKLAGTALSMVGAGIASSYSCYPWAYIAPYAFFTSAGVFALGAASYGLYCYFKQQRAHHDPAKHANSTLFYAMRLFKNYSPAIATKFGDDKSMVVFLQNSLNSCPENSPFKSQFKHMIEIVKIFESGEGDIESIIKNYEEWKATPSGSFNFFVPQAAKTFTLVKLTAENSITPELFRSYLSSIKQCHKEKKPLPSQFWEKDKSLTRLFHTWLKTEENPAYHANKKIYYIGLLRKIVQENPEWTQDRDLRAWMASTVLHLRQDLNLEIKDASLRKDWSHAVAFLGTLENTLLMESRASQPIADHDTYKPLQIESLPMTPQIAFPGIAKIETGVKVPTNKKTIEAPTSREFSALREWHTYFFTMFKSSSATSDLLDSEVTRFLLDLPKASSLAELIQTWTKEQKIQYIGMLDEMARLVITSNYASGRLTPHPSRFLALLKTLDVALLLSQSAYQLPVHQTFLYTKSFYSGLKDPYFDLGAYQSVIYETLSSINGKAAANLEVGVYNVVPLKTHQDATKVKNLGKLLNAFLQPQKFLKAKDEKIPTRNAFKTYINELGKLVKKEAFQAFNSTQLIALDKKQLSPLSLSYEPKDAYRFDKTDDYKKLEILGPPISPYYYFMEHAIPNKDIRWRLIEGRVTIGIAPDCDSDGAYATNSRQEIYDSHGYPRDNHGLNQTLQLIHEDKFVFPMTTLETSRELQKMASGRDNRASNALYTFNQNAHLLLQADHSQSYQQVLRLFLFQSDLLIRELQLNPKMGLLCFRNLDDLLLKFEQAKDWNAWLAIYRIHIDVCANLIDGGFSSEDRINQQTSYSKKLFKILNESKDNQPALHLTYLYEKAILGYQSAEVVTIAKSIFKVKLLIEHKLRHAPLEGQILFDFIYRILPVLIERIEKEGLEILNTIFDSNYSWEQVEKGIYKSKKIYLNLREFQIAKSGVIESNLPSEIIDNDSLAELFGEEALKKTYVFTYVHTSLGKAWYVALTKGNTQYHLYLNKDNPQFPLLYRQQDNKPLEQWIRTLKDDERLSIDFKKGFLWMRQGSCSHEDPAGLPLYIPHFRENQLTRLERCLPGGNEVVLDHQNAALFAHIDTPDGFVATQGAATTHIYYIRGNVGYSWNTLIKKWESSLYKGFYLTVRSLHNWLPKSTQAVDRDSSLFSSAFTSYHLLENAEGKAKLILPIRAYTKGKALKEVHEKEVKYSSTYNPLSNAESPWNKQGFACFDIDANGVVKTKQPKDFLYLAYVLFIQGKYGKAMLYLQKSQVVWNASEAQRSQIKNWIMQWSDTSANASAFKAKFLLWEHRLQEASFISTSDLIAHDARFLPDLMVEFTKYRKQKAKVDPLLHFSKQEREDISLLVPRAIAWVTPKIHIKVLAALYQKRFANFIKQRLVRQKRSSNGV